MAISTLSSRPKIEFETESVVELATEIEGEKAPRGRLVLKGALGPGFVVDNSRSDLVRVRWPRAELDTWIARRDLEPEEPSARLLAIYRYDTDGYRTVPVCRVITNAGLYHNWKVEIEPENIIRTIRSDNLVWTFDWHPIVQRVQPHGTLLLDALAEDDHAEALTVAELAIADAHFPLTPAF